MTLPSRLFIHRAPGGTLKATIQPWGGSGTEYIRLDEHNTLLLQAKATKPKPRAKPKPKKEK